VPRRRPLERFPKSRRPKAGKLFDALKERIFRDEMLKDRRRPDGRKFDEVRKIESKWACCRARTDRRCSRAAKRRRW
jgi:polyribonucleotide nucleotidyltransferase